MISSSTGCFHCVVWPGSSSEDLVSGLYWLHQLLPPQVWITAGGGHHIAHLPWPLPLPVHLLSGTCCVFNADTNHWVLLHLCNGFFHWGARLHNGAYLLTLDWDRILFFLLLKYCYYTTNLLWLLCLFNTVISRAAYMGNWTQLLYLFDPFQLDCKDKSLASHITVQRQISIDLSMPTTDQYALLFGGLSLQTI